MGEWILLQDGLLIYFGIAILLLTSTVGVPPEEPVIFFGGVAAQRANVEGVLVFLICYLAILVGDLAIYLAGRRLGPKVFEKEWFRKRLSPTRISKVKFNLERRSLVMIFLARHLIYLRTITFLTCGAVRMRFEKFLLADAVAALLSVSLLMGLGYLAADNYEAMLSFIDRAKFFLMILLVPVVYYVWRTRHRKLALREEVEQEN